ncbi:hypothetical protein PZT57_26460 [Pseudomonas aeruginosa]|uniref:hypothetical protein n=1 Tax=Pseudomonas aeruginosa TaxID=287 RepID=UPI002B2715B7|nr:hypothetical protein [Pseudomonas aeruginosa]MEA8592192.1 hypothetical protein [Pseudomonas aeruginosa]
MKLFTKTVAAVVVAFAIASVQAQESVKKPLSIDVHKPTYVPNTLGDHDPDWQVSVTASSVDSTGAVVNEPVFSFRVQSGLCTSGKKRVVDMKPNNQVEVTQKACVGTIDGGKTRIVGWVFANSENPDVLMEESKRELVYGTLIEFTVDGGYLDAKVGAYRVTAARIDG